VKNGGDVDGRGEKVREGKDKEVKVEPRHGRGRNMKAGGQEGRRKKDVSQSKKHSGWRGAKSEQKNRKGEKYN